MKTEVVAVLSSRVRKGKQCYPHAGLGCCTGHHGSVDSPRQGKYVPGTLASMTALCMVKHVRIMNNRKESTQKTDPGRTATFSGRLGCTGSIERPVSEEKHVHHKIKRKAIADRPQGKQTESWN